MIDFISITLTQSHYREVPRWEIFMEQELRFGQLFWPVFSSFHEQKKFKKIKTLPQSLQEEG